MNRREFLEAGVSSAAACALAGSALGADMARTRRLANIGIIGGVYKDAGDDWQKALRHMAEVGYTILEGRPKGESVPDFLRFLKEIGMTLVSCGVEFGKTVKDGWLDTAIASKAQYATTFWPWFYAPDKLTLPQLKEIAEQLNRCGEKCKAAGLRFAVHNHDHEFRILEGKPIMDHLLELTQPDLVAVELDIYWAVKGGADPLDYFKRYPGRFELFHVKDMGPAPDRAFVPVGSGTIDFARIFDKSEQAGVKHYIVELEGASATTKGAEESCRHLRQLRY